MFTVDYVQPDGTVESCSIPSGLDVVRESGAFIAPNVVAYAIATRDGGDLCELFMRDVGAKSGEMVLPIDHGCWRIATNGSLIAVICDDETSQTSFKPISVYDIDARVPVQVAHHDDYEFGWAVSISRSGRIAVIDRTVLLGTVDDGLLAFDFVDPDATRTDASETYSEIGPIWIDESRVVVFGFAAWDSTAEIARVINVDSGADQSDWFPARHPVDAWNQFDGSIALRLGAWDQAPVRMEYGDLDALLGALQR